MKRETIGEGIYRDAHGITARVSKGSGTLKLFDEKRFALGTELAEIRAWQDKARVALGEQLAAGAIAAGILDDDMLRYLKTARLTPAVPPHLQAASAAAAQLLAELPPDVPQKAAGDEAACGEVMAFAKGDHVRLTVGMNTIDAIVALASSNGRALILAFDEGVWVNGGMVIGCLPVLKKPDETWSEILAGSPVTLERT